MVKKRFPNHWAIENCLSRVDTVSMGSEDVFAIVAYCEHLRRRLQESENGR